MAEKILDVKIKQRYDTEVNWKASDPILLEGECAYSSDKNNQYKQGNGTSKWSELSYAKASPLSHTHTKSQITDFPTSLKNPSALTIQFNGTTNKTYNGSSAQTVNITPNSIGAATASHGTHVTFGTDTPKAAGTAAVGTATTVSRSDHIHPVQTSVSGNAGTATKWATARNINGMSVQGDANRVNYGTCSTAAATVAKVVNCTGFALITGSEITVKFMVTNTASSPTLNVNSTGAKAIYYRGAAISAGYLAANRTYTFRYNGTQYDLVGDLDTQRGIVNNLTSTSTTSSLSAAQGKELKTLIDGTTVSQSDIDDIFV